MIFGRSRSAQPLSFDPFGWYLGWLLSKLFGEIVSPTLYKIAKSLKTNKSKVGFILVTLTVFAFYNFILPVGFKMLFDYLGIAIEILAIGWFIGIIGVVLAVIFWPNKKRLEDCTSSREYYDMMAFRRRR